MSDFANSSTQLVAEVDCTAAGEELCTMNDVQGFPTLKVSSLLLRVILLCYYDNLGNHIHNVYMVIVW